MIQVHFEKLQKDAIVPTQAYSTDAGIDFYSLYEYPNIASSSTIKVQTGIRWKPVIVPYYDTPTQKAVLESFIQNNFNIYMKIEDRSGLASKESLHVKAGVIDQSYRGEIIIVMQNHGKHNVTLLKGQKIAQGIVYTIPKIYIRQSNFSNNSERGSNGFGSTGV
jgi:dUTP pyrophosphatase